MCIFRSLFSWKHSSYLDFCFQLFQILPFKTSQPLSLAENDLKQGIHVPNEHNWTTERAGPDHLYAHKEAYLYFPTTKKCKCLFWVAKNYKIIKNSLPEFYIQHILHKMHKPRPKYSAIHWLNYFILKMQLQTNKLKSYYEIASPKLQDLGIGVLEVCTRQPLQITCIFPSQTQK